VIPRKGKEVDSESYVYNGAFYKYDPIVDQLNNIYAPGGNDGSRKEANYFLLGRNGLQKLNENLLLIKNPLVNNRTDLDLGFGDGDFETAAADGTPVSYKESLYIWNIKDEELYANFVQATDVKTPANEANSFVTKMHFDRFLSIKTKREFYSFDTGPIKFDGFVFIYDTHNLLDNQPIRIWPNHSAETEEFEQAEVYELSKSKKLAVAKPFDTIYVNATPILNGGQVIVIDPYNDMGKTTSNVAPPEFRIHPLSFPAAFSDRKLGINGVFEINENKITIHSNNQTRGAIDLYDLEQGTTTDYSGSTGGDNLGSGGLKVFSNGMIAVKSPSSATDKIRVYSDEDLNSPITLAETGTGFGKNIIEIEGTNTILASDSNAVHSIELSTLSNSFSDSFAVPQSDYNKFNRPHKIHNNITTFVNPSANTDNGLVQLFIPKNGALNNLTFTTGLDGMLGSFGERIGHYGVHKVSDNAAVLTNKSGDAYIIPLDMFEN